jgi:dihydrofolate reductase
MRKLIYSVGISLDGYIARPDGSVDFLFLPDDFSMGPFFETLDAAVMGRKTFDKAMEMGGLFGPSVPTYVFSRTLPEAGASGVKVVTGPVGDWLKSMRAQPGKDIWLMGGADLAGQFFEDDLVDELHLGVVPVLIGSGIPAFSQGVADRSFDLVEQRSFSRGLVTLKYQRARPPAR